MYVEVCKPWNIVYTRKHSAPVAYSDWKKKPKIRKCVRNSATDKYTIYTIKPI